MLGVVLLALVAGVGLAGRRANAISDLQAMPPSVQCHFDSSCPEVNITGDPPATLSGGPAPFRGYGDPTLERDPLTGTIWLAYSWLDTLVNSAGPPPVLNRAVQTHLARSDDGGATFTFVRPVNVATQLTHPDTGVPGWADHEVPSLLYEASDWQMVWLTYFAPYGDFPPGPTDSHSDFYLVRSTAAAPGGLGDSSQAWTDGSGTSPSFGVKYNLSTLPQLSDCAAFTEPALFDDGGAAYLAVNCVVVANGVRRPDLERLVLLKETTAGYSYAGALLTYADAQYVSASRLEQADINRSASGALLLIVTPISETTPENHGCIVYQITDVASAQIRRDDAGHAAPLASIAGDPSDATIGAGQCTYDASSASGVLIVMHQVSNAIVYSLHATGLHPDVPASVGGVAGPPALHIEQRAGRQAPGAAWYVWTSAVVLAIIVGGATLRRRLRR